MASPQMEEANEPSVANIKPKMAWTQLAGSIGACFAAACSGVTVSYTAVAVPQFMAESSPHLKMDLETVSWFGEEIEHF